jgi:hypothetical protein
MRYVKLCEAKPLILKVNGVWTVAWHDRYCMFKWLAQARVAVYHMNKFGKWPSDEKFY